VFLAAALVLIARGAFLQLAGSDFGRTSVGVSSDHSPHRYRDVEIVRVSGHRLVSRAVAVPRPVVLALTVIIAITALWIARFTAASGVESVRRPFQGRRVPITSRGPPAPRFS